ncbi:MAG: LptE family protein [Sphingobacteriales bacterium]|nr:LptE family protein [Sphingobacteriales bacterium]
MTRLKKIAPLAAIALISLFALLGNSSCGIYRFTDASIPDSIKTIKVNLIENRATYINPQLSPRLSDKLRQKIVSQTKLTQTNNDNADWEISGTITQYSFSTSAISGQQASNNRLTVGVQIILTDRKADKIEKHEVSRSFEFKGDRSFQQAENELAEEMIRTLTDDIFNKLFSKW